MKIITLGTGAGNPSTTRFNTATLLECGNNFYLIDAGAPVTSLMKRKNLDINRLRAVFISHMHGDHFGGLIGVLKNRMRYLNSDSFIEVYFSESKAGPVFRELMALQYKGAHEEKIHYRTIKTGYFYQDENLTIKAIPNNHFKWQGKIYPSFSFLINSNDKKILYSGDLSDDFSDFPRKECEEAQICLCELTHFPIDIGMDYFAGTSIEKLIFTHIGHGMTNDEAKKFFAEKIVSLPFTSFMAFDGDEFEI